MEPEYNRVSKGLAAAQAMLIFLAVLIAAGTPPAAGYELSLYDAFPSIFWIALLGSILIGVLLIVRSAISGPENDPIWKTGLFSMLFAYGIFLALPFFRGYLLYGRGDADVFSHLGWSRVILSSGFLAYNDFYPIVHIQVAVLEYTGMTLEQASLLLSIVFSLLLLLFAYMLARAVSATPGQALFIVAFASPLLFGVFHHSIHPSILSVFLIPAALAMYHRKGSERAAPAFALLAILLTFIMVFFHPVTAIIMLIILLVFGLGNLFVRHFGTTYAPEANVVYLIVVLTVSLFAWLNPFSGLGDKLNAVLAALIVGDATPMISHYGNILGQANLSILQVFELVMGQYGHIVVYLLATGAALLLVLGYFLSGRMYRSEFYYSLQVIAGICFTGAMVIGYFIEFEPIRVARYAIIVIPVLCGLTFYHYAVTLKSETRQKVFVGFMLLLICSASAFSVFSVFYSPRVVKANTQLTSMEMTGVVWYFDRADLDTPLVASDLNLARYEMYHYGYGTPEYYAPRLQVRDLIPSRFGYSANRTLFEQFENPATYMVTTEINRQSYLAYPEAVRPLVTRYLPGDFVRLSADQSVMQSYENGEFEVWYISEIPA